MTALRRFGFALLILTAGASFSRADLLVAPTGTYTGTLAYTRSLTLKTANPTRTVKHKTITRVNGFGYIPTGLTTTFIRLIVPGRNVFDVGVDREITIDFAQDPPLVRVGDGTHAIDFAFATVTVKNKVVTCVITISGNTTDYETKDVRTLRLTRTKP